VASDLARKQDLVQSKVVAVNLLIRNNFSRPGWPEIQPFLQPSGAKIATEIPAA
jgi:hypothetical protein